MKVVHTVPGSMYAYYMTSQSTDRQLHAYMHADAVTYWLTSPVMRTTPMHAAGVSPPSWVPRDTSQRGGGRVFDGSPRTGSSFQTSKRAWVGHEAWRGAREERRRSSSFECPSQAPRWFCDTVGVTYRFSSFSPSVILVKSRHKRRGKWSGSVRLAYARKERAAVLLVPLMTCVYLLNTQRGTHKKHRVGRDEVSLSFKWAKVL